MKRHTVTQSQSERQPVIGSLNVRSKFRHVIKLFILLDEGIKHQCAHPFAGGVDRRRSNWIDCLDVIGQRNDETVAAIAPAG